MEMTTQEKSNFRQTVAWKEFRRAMLARGNCQCELCGMRYTGSKIRLLNVHHRLPQEYDRLQPELFALLCHDHHEMVEGYCKRVLGKGFKPYPDFPAVFAALKKYMTFDAVIKGEQLL